MQGIFQRSEIQMPLRVVRLLYFAIAFCDEINSMHANNVTPVCYIFPLLYLGIVIPQFAAQTIHDSLPINGPVMFINESSLLRITQSIP